MFWFGYFVCLIAGWFGCFWGWFVLTDLISGLCFVLCFCFVLP